MVTVSKKLPSEKRLERRAEKVLEEVSPWIWMSPRVDIKTWNKGKVSMPSNNVFSEQGVIERRITSIRIDSDGVSLKKCRF